MGLSKFVEICHKIFSFLLSIRKEAVSLAEIDNILLKGHADAKKGKGEGGLHGRKVRGFKGTRQKKGRSLIMQLQIQVEDD